MSSDQQMRGVVERIEALVEACARSTDPAARRGAQELVQLLMRLYGAGLSRVLQLVRLHDGDGRTEEALLEDDLVASLLVLHDLHPEDVETRVRRGLERLQEPTGARMTLLALRDGTARVLVEDERRTASALDLQRLIDDLIRAVAPDVGSVEIEGLPPRAVPPLIQLRRNGSADRPAGSPTR